MSSQTVSLPRDANRVTVIGGASSSDGSTPVAIYADPITHRLLVSATGGGSGTVSTVSVVSANGFAGTVANPTTTPAITISTTITGIVKGNGTAISAGVAGDVDSILPTQTGQSGKVLSTNGTNSSWIAAGGTGTVTSVSVTTANGVSGTVATATTTPAITLTLGAITPSAVQVSGLTASSAVATDASKNLVSVTNTGTGNNVLAVSPALTGTPTAPTQATGDNTTAIATDAFVTTAIANAIAGVNPATAVAYATTAAGDTSGLTYSNGVSGIGATLTGANNTAVTIDGHTFVVGDVGISRLLVKNDTQSPSGAFNGVYLFTALQTVGTGAIFTRALDYDTPSDINNTGAIPVVNGTANADTSWLLTSNITTVGTSPLTYTQFTLNPTTLVVGPASATSGVPALFNGTTGKLIQNSTPTGTGNPVMQTSPSLTTPTLGVATATTINGNTFTTGTYTLTGTASKTLNFTNTLTLSGTDSTTMTFPGTSQTVAGLTSTQTFTNKRITRRVVTTTQSATPTINTDNTDMASITGLAQAITSMTTNLSGTPVQGDFLEIQITDNGTARAITWGASFSASTVALPTTTVISTLLHVLFEWDATLKWVCVAVA